MMSRASPSLATRRWPWRGKSSPGSYHLGVSVPLYSSTLFTNFNGGYCRTIMDVRGTKTNQSLFISADALHANTNYLVRVLRRGTTNIVDAAIITSDKLGRSHVTFIQRPDGKVSGNSMPLPAAMNPVSEVALVQVIFDSNSAFAGDLNARTKMNYKVQVLLDNDGVEANAAAALQIRSNFTLAYLTVHQTNSVTQIIDSNSFLINATSLTPNTPYSVALNGVIVTNLTADASGDFSLRLLDRAGQLPFPTQPDGTIHIEQFVDIDIVDANTNSVLSVTLP